MNSSALSPTFVWPCPEQSGSAVGLFYVEIEGPSWLLDNVDRGLLKIYTLRCLTRPLQTRFLVFRTATVRKSLQ